jgi:hypothetical protein
MDEQQVEFVLVQLELDPDMGGQRTEVGSLLVLYDQVSIGDRDGAADFLFFGLIGAATCEPGGRGPSSCPRACFVCP